MPNPNFLIPLTTITPLLLVVIINLALVLLGEQPEPAWVAGVTRKQR